MTRKHLFSFFSASIMAVLGGGLLMPLGCAAEDPNDENVGEAELAVGEGGMCYVGASECNAGLNCCGTAPPYLIGVCRNFQTDEANCGSCGHACLGTQQCNMGHCCGVDDTLCPAGCKNLEIDRNNCGSCGHACALNEVCNGGACE